jgi:hypothetical protein
MKYSIVYIETRPEIQERISIGLIVIAGSHIEVRTSRKKLKAAENLLTAKEYEFVARTLRNMRKNIKTEQTVDYLARYSNNLITISPMQTIDIDNSSRNWDWLYRNYVYSLTKGNAVMA